VRAQAGDEVVGFAFSKAIEKKVGCDEVVLCDERFEGAGVCANCGETVLRADAGHASFEETQHCWAQVDGFGADLRVGGEELCEETAIAVSDDECLAGISEGGQMVEAAALEHWAEGEILHRAVEVCYAVKAKRALGVCGALDHPCHGRTKRSGVRRAASAAMRIARRKLVDVYKRQAVGWGADRGGNVIGS